MSMRAEIRRRLLRNFAIMSAGYGAGWGIALASGLPPWPVLLAGIAVSTLVILACERSIQEAFLRRITGRRKPDYARIAALKRELNEGRPGQ